MLGSGCLVGALSFGGEGPVSRPRVPALCVRPEVFVGPV